MKFWCLMVFVWKESLSLVGIAMVWSPHARKMRRVTGIKGVYLGCKPTDGGLIRSCWESMEVGQRINLGKRVDVSSTPIAIQVAFHNIERVYLNACKVDTLEAWGKFQRV